MPFSYRKVRRYRRGATWSDGTPRMCTRCGAAGRGRRRQAVVTAVLCHTSSPYQLPVSYCPDDIPQDLEEAS